MATETTPAAELQPVVVPDALAHEWVLLQAYLERARIALVEVQQQVVTRRPVNLISLAEMEASLELAASSWRALTEAGFVKTLGG